MVEAIQEFMRVIRLVQNVPYRVIFNQLKTWLTVSAKSISPNTDR
jgi:hypothetical protein